MHFTINPIGHNMINPVVVARNNLPPTQKGNLNWGATSIAMALMVGIYALGSISGAHFNPAVTLAVACSNKMLGGWQHAAVYMLFQVFGGICAGLTSTKVRRS